MQKIFIFIYRWGGGGLSEVSAHYEPPEQLLELYWRDEHRSFQKLFSQMVSPKSFINF